MKTKLLILGLSVCLYITLIITIPIIGRANSNSKWRGLDQSVYSLDYGDDEYNLTINEVYISYTKYNIENINNYSKAKKFKRKIYFIVNDINDVNEDLVKYMDGILVDSSFFSGYEELNNFVEKIKDKNINIRIIFSNEIYKEEEIINLSSKVEKIIISVNTNIDFINNLINNKINFDVYGNSFDKTSEEFKKYITNAKKHNFYYGYMYKLTEMENDNA